MYTEEGSFTTCNLEHILASCPALRALEVCFDMHEFDRGHQDGILRLTALQELKLFFCEDDVYVWERLLPRLT